MKSNHDADQGRWRQWTGRALSGLGVLFLLFDSTAKLLQVQPVIEGALRVQSPLFTHVLFPAYVAAVLWGGLLLRDARLRAFLPVRSAS